MASSRILESPSAERNKGPIWDLLADRVFPSLSARASSDAASAGGGGRGVVRVLEVAAGCGVHTAHFASSFRRAYGPAGVTIAWRPSDPDPAARASVDARASVGSGILPAVDLVLGAGGGLGGTACGAGERGGASGGARPERDAAPRAEETEGGAGGAANGTVDLVTCINMIHIAPWEATLGLMSVAGTALRSGGLLYCYGPYMVGGTAVPSNLNFDASLRSRDSRWGVRDLEEVIAVAKKHGLELVESVEMPANNLSVIYRKK